MKQILYLLVILGVLIGASYKFTKENLTEELTITHKHPLQTQKDPGSFYYQLLEMLRMIQH